MFASRSIDCEQSLFVPQKSVDREQSLTNSPSTSHLHFCVSSTEQDSEEQKETGRNLVGTRIEGGNINESNTKFYKAKQEAIPC